MKNLTFKRLVSLLLILAMTAALLLTTGCQFPVGGDIGDGGKNEGTSGQEEVENDPVRNEFIEGLGGVSETFKGAVSELSYPSAEEAAEAFVAEELSGESEAKIENVVSNGTLSDSEIKESGIPADLLEGCDAVEEYEVTYVLNEDSASDFLEDSGMTKLAAKDTLNKSVKVKVYVIKINNEWKYFTPMPVTGDTISKSYYDSVFNSEKYKNCTFESTTEMEMVVTNGPETMNMTMKMSQLIKFQEGKIYLEQTTEMSNETGEMETDAMYAYMEETDDGIACYVKMGKDSTEWMEGDLTMLGFMSLDDLAPFADQYLDYTYFTKTNYGFALEEENARRYMSTALGGSLGSLGVDFDSDDAKLEMLAEYYVCGGVLSGMRNEADIEMEVTADGITNGIKEVVKATTTCTDYGTTVVEKPFVD
ncbi:MAG: hypothetical protein E7643_05785 [Ruminococcaceae bacterium]|nr:hypothetical protein [Oscillospiraceae bacterium]